MKGVLILYEEPPEERRVDVSLAPAVDFWLSGTHRKKARSVLTPPLPLYLAFLVKSRLEKGMDQFCRHAGEILALFRDLPSDWQKRLADAWEVEADPGYFTHWDGRMEPGSPPFLDARLDPAIPSTLDTCQEPAIPSSLNARVDPGIPPSLVARLNSGRPPYLDVPLDSGRHPSLNARMANWISEDAGSILPLLEGRNWLIEQLERRLQRDPVPLRGIAEGGWPASQYLPLLLQYLYFHGEVELVSGISATLAKGSVEPRCERCGSGGRHIHSYWCSLCNTMDLVCDVCYAMGASKGCSCLVRRAKPLVTGAEIGRMPEEQEPLLVWSGRL